MARGLPQHGSRDVGRDDQVVSTREMQVAHPVLELLAEHAAARMPDPEPRTQLFGGREEVELAAQQPVVAPLGLLETVQVRL
jgi:hypothetical protein